MAIVNSMFRMAGSLGDFIKINNKDALRPCFST